MLLINPENYGDAINSIKNDIAYLLVELKIFEEELLFHEWKVNYIHMIDDV